MKKKLCNKCKQEKPVSDFYFRKKLKTNYGSICKSCENISRKKYYSTLKILGCSFEEFKIHIESQWELWMNWDNYGVYKINEQTWQIDHIIPISSAKTKEDIMKLNHFSNLRPLCSKENILKSNH